jgi:hypothetical protein
MHTFVGGDSSAENEFAGTMSDDDANAVREKRKNAMKTGEETVVILHNVGEAERRTSMSIMEIVNGEEASKDEKEDGFNVAPFNGTSFFHPFVVDNDTAIEMEYFEQPVITSEEVSPSMDTVLVSTNQITHSKAPSLTFDSVSQNVETREKEDLESTVSTSKRQSYNFESIPIDSMTSNDTADKGTNAIEKRSKQNRGLMLIPRKLTRARIKAFPRRIRCEHLHSPRNSTQNPVVQEKISDLPEEVNAKSLTYAVNIQPETKVKKHGEHEITTERSLTVNDTIESVTVEEQIRKKATGTIDGNCTRIYTNRPVELSKMISSKNQYSGTVGSSLADAVSNEMTLTTDTDFGNSTIQEASIIDDDDDQSDSSFTFLSSDSTYRSDGSEFVARCGIRPCF